MRDLTYLSDMPIAVLGSGAVGKTIAADCKLAGKEVRLYGSKEFAKKSIDNLHKTGILLDGIQRNRDGFERSGKAFLDLASSNMEEVVKGAGIICVAITSGVLTPIIDSMIVIGGAFHKKNYFVDSRYSLDYIGISKMTKEQLLDYLHNGK